MKACNSIAKYSQMPEALRNIEQWPLIISMESTLPEKRQQEKWYGRRNMRPYIGNISSIAAGGFLIIESIAAGQENMSDQAGILA